MPDKKTVKEEAPKAKAEAPAKGKKQRWIRNDEVVHGEIPPGYKEVKDVPRQLRGTQMFKEGRMMLVESVA
jgi:hypothetical protein